ncbi:PA2169 family four-helix-bundle protein [Fulvivirgaceae bacterium PWU4]|uniref:PA2169 family four-helix-bundle protein n=1 Tax=Chryseosolibacter histidini TaxID=2782349 RepID=A0AAP2DM19_9BACT|nr:PA2169 family four-helix-bundle protein [Chryseosolibacter histidini]MBT1698805.1 PA2169 family four-helix-bundle protein [Chryseosolibacter histidini]
MKPDNELIGILNDLIRINHDRTEGYQKAVEELKPTDIDLRTMFTNAASASVQYANDLAAEVRNLGGDPSSDSTQSGKIYRVWMDIRSGVSARDRKSILSLCEFGEDAALRVYRLSLEDEVPMPRDVRELIEEQKHSIQAMHDTVKRHRDMQETVKP